jgi:pre-mRNA-splicing factor ATP-dependent RNA helicase DHX15/PRP43
VAFERNPVLTMAKCQFSRTGRPYSARYLEILQKRRTLPVWQQKDDFLAVLRDNQTLILVVETGSSKTT